ncbi:M24 family metallopeptidase [Kineococcus rhizosphaerae]|uniref:Xaa-Pro aminopeptidase n=1 Tax=Kineococcus rhizosphaerae TaxID=559628 RepID=A0A2T0QR82_9ACTN|nr:M24 family metallopeptidase [Kineococcus rhizosphaerae]PRY07345.1 Xaa-Pro aminopeptidase [Kineococcus rhizosphaerae]
MLTNRIPVEEFHGRWSRVQEICKERSLDALVVWSKGGGPIDMSEDVVYLANHYAVFPYCPDGPGVWSGLGAAAVVVPSTGEPTLIVGSDQWRTDNVSITDVRVSPLLPDAIVEVLRDIRATDRVGLVAGAGMTVEPYRRLLEVSPGIDWVPMDATVEQLRARKSPFEFQLLRESCEVGNAAMLAMMKTATRPGATEAEAALAAYDVVLRAGGTIIDAAIASGPNSHFYAYGQMPQWTTRTLEAGDIFNCDMYGSASEGYRWDFSRTTVTGSKPTTDQLEVIEGSIAAVEAGVSALRPGVTTGAVWDALHGVLVDRGIDIGYDIGGHSYGLAWESPWVAAGGEEVIEAGMAIAIETIAGREGVGNAKFEHNVLVHADSIELLSTSPSRPWLL